MTPSFQFSPTIYIPPALTDWLEEEALSTPLAPAPYWKTDAVTLYHGETTAILRGLPAGSVNCVITSPPYWALRNYGVDCQIGLERTPEQFISRLVDVFIELHRVLRDDSTVWIVMGDMSHDTVRSLLGMPTKFGGPGSSPTGAKCVHWDLWIYRDQLLLVEYGEGKWVDLLIGREVSKQVAVERKQKITDDIAQLFTAMLPVYQACSRLETEETLLDESR